MKKKWMIIILCLILIIIGMYVIYLKTHEKEDVEEKVEFSQTYNLGIVDKVETLEWIGVAEDGISTCIVQYDFPTYTYDIVPGKYIIEIDEEWVEKYSDYGVIYEYEYSEIGVYDIETKERRLLFDVTDFTEQNSEFQVVTTLRDGCYEVNGQQIYQRKYEPCPQEGVLDSETDVGYIWVNIEDGSYSVQESGIKKQSTHTTDIFQCLENHRLLRNNLPNEMLEELYYFYSFPYQNYEGVFEVRGLAEYLPRNNEVLYSLFPELEQYRGEENCYIYMLIGGNPSDEELLRLFMEDGQEISFSGGLLSGQYTIDGEDHEIYSFEDYERWRAYDE